MDVFIPNGLFLSNVTHYPLAGMDKTQWARELGLVRRTQEKVPVCICIYYYFTCVYRLQLSKPPVHVPLHSSEHFYIVTKPMKGDFNNT